MGIALESEQATDAQALARGRDKLQQKGLDLVVCNRSSAIGSERGAAVLLWADGRRADVPEGSKSGLAQQIVAAAVQLWEDRSRR